jgi:hypothetical protein
LFYYGSQGRFRDILDGTSQTIVFAETLLGNGIANTTRPVKHHDAVAWIGHASPSDPDVETLTKGPVWAWNGYRGYAWILGKSYSTTFSTYLPPNPRHPDVSALSFGWFSARSHHEGGVHVTLADGSVRFVTDSVDLEIWRNAGSIADGAQSDGEL